MQITSIFSVLLLTPAILATPILETGAAEFFSSAAAVVGGNAVASASAVGGTSASSNSASASASSSSAFKDVSSVPLLPIHYGSVQSVPVEENLQTVQHVPVVQNYQAIQYLPLIQQQFPAFVYGGGYGGGYDDSVRSLSIKRGTIGGAGIGGGFGRYRESYTFKARGFGSSLNGFGHHGFGGGRFKAHYSTGGVAAGGFADIKAGVFGGGAAGILS